MNLFRNWLVWMIAVSVLASFTLIACSGDDDDDDDAADDDVADDDAGDDDAGDDDAASCTLEDICQFVIDNCDEQGGYADLAQCEELWLTGCVDPDAYLVCACGCLGADSCGAFIDDCEYPDCWAVYCE